MQYKICEKCGRRYKRKFCEFCDRESKFNEEDYYHLLTPRIARDLKQINIDIDPDELNRLNQGGGLFIVGKVGSGKTLYAAKMMMEWLRRSYIEIGKAKECLFITIPDLLDRIRRSYWQEQEDETLKMCYSNNLLVLDDLGVEKISEWVNEKLDQLINYRYEQLYPTIFTSNLGGKEIANRIGDRIPSRIQQMCEKKKMNNNDHRLK